MTKWHVYLKDRATKQWVGEIEAVDEREAIEIAAKEADGGAAAIAKRIDSEARRFAR